MRVNPSALVCRNFAILGYCSLGAACSERHVHECPNWSNVGICHDRNCRLPHVDRAGQLRKQTANLLENQRSNDEANTLEDCIDDISSDEDNNNGSDSDDIDSDGIEDGITLQPQTGDPSPFQQDDFIYL